MIRSILGKEWERVWLLLFPVAAVYVWVASSALRPLPGDEGIYIAAGKLLLTGVIPYRDFFLAHPPLRVLTASLVLLVTGSPVAVKAVSLAALVATGFLLQRTVGRVSHPLVGLACGAFFLLARTTLDSGGFFIGVDLALFFLVFGVERLSAGRPLAAGVLHAVSLLAALHSAPAIAACAGWVCVRGRLSARHLAAAGRCEALSGPQSALPEQRPATGSPDVPPSPVRYGLGLALAAVVFAALALWPGRCFVDQVFLYHLGKHAAMPGFGDSADVVVTFLDRHKALLVLSMTGFLALRSRLLPLAAACLVVTLAAVSCFSSIHDFYYLIALPFAAWMAAVGLGTLVREGARHGKIAAVLAALPALLLLADIVPALEAGAQFATTRSQGEALLSGLSSTVGAGAPPGSLLGDSSVAPWIGLLTGRPLSGNELDTNPKRFYSAATEVEEFLRKLDQDPPAVVVTVPGHGLGSVPEVRDWIRGRYPAAVPLIGGAAGSRYEVRCAR